MIFELLGINSCQSYFIISIVLWVSAWHAYRVNSRLPDDDPKKKDFSLFAVFLAPFTAPLLIFGMISLFILKAILYGIFLVLLTLALVVIRKPFIFVLLDKIAKKVGNILLEVNTQLIKMFLSPWIGNPQPS